jgi:hypothetical protein
VTLLADVVEHLDARSIPAALIGAAALAVHGVARATEDLDLLAVDTAVLDEGLWRELQDADELAVRRGDFEDPLAGLIRLRRGDELVEVVVGKGAWMRAILDRRSWLTLRAERIPVVDAADLLLLKLYAGGPQDLLDARLLLGANLDQHTTTVEARLPTAPPFLADAWRHLLGSRS